MIVAEGAPFYKVSDLISASSKLFLFLNKGGKFLKKLWCCIGGRVYQGNLGLSAELTM